MESLFAILPSLSSSATTLWSHPVLSSAMELSSWSRLTTRQKLFFSQKKISRSQVNLQLLFIADLKHKCVAEEHKRTKPGRQVQQDQQICLSWDCLALSSFAINGCHNDLQVVTFLILCNLGLWITYNFEIQKVAATPDQVNLFVQFV